MAHVTHRVGDTIYCRKCGKSWDVSESDVPECVTDVQRTKYLKFIKAKGIVK